MSLVREILAVIVTAMFALAMCVYDASSYELNLLDLNIEMLTRIHITT